MRGVYLFDPTIPWDTMRTLCLHERSYDVPYQIRVKVLGLSLKTRHDVTKIDFIVFLLSLLCINIDLNIQPISFVLYMTYVHKKLYK